MAAPHPPARTTVTASSWRRVRLAVALAAGATCVACAAAESRVADEYAVKAAYLYNFTRFIEWPPDHFPDEQAPIRVGVFGENPFGDGLRATVQNRTANGRAVEVIELQSDRPPAGVDLVFVGASEEKRFLTLSPRMNLEGVLVIGETPGFANAGGAITFVQQDDKIRFAINLEATERARIKVSSKLLSVALGARGPGRTRP